MRLTLGVYEQVGETYRRMAEEARYRPAAPSDGMGNITVPLAELDLDAEADAYARTWWAEEDSLTFWIGCASFPTRPATVFAIEAARNLCATADDAALRLLRMAVADLEERISRRAAR